MAWKALGHERLVENGEFVPNDWPMKEESESMKEKFDLMAWLSEPPVAHRCPQCGGSDCERIPRTFVQRLILGRRRPYCCLECRYRFFDTPKGTGEKGWYVS